MKLTTLLAVLFFEPKSSVLSDDIQSFETVLSEESLYL
jgi:hypothetical protein